MRTYSFRELKESKLLYDKKPPAFGVIITLLTLLLLSATITWAYFSTKTYVVKANGIVTSEQKANVMNTVSGEVSSINVKEGQQVKAGDVIFTIDTFQVDLQIAQIQGMVDLYDKKISTMNRLVEFINAYQLADAATQLNPFDSSKMDEINAYSIADSFITSVNAQVEQNGSEAGNEFTQEQLDSAKYQYLSQQAVFSAIDEYYIQKTQQQSQLDAYQGSLSSYSIKATVDGTIHLTPGMTVGTVIQAGALAGSIVSNDSANYILEVAVDAVERSKLNVDSDVEIALGGIMQSEYGILSGKVLAIDSDSTQSEEGVFYYAKVKPSSDTLTNDLGETINIALGMVGECRIKYDETTWLKWCLEQLIGKFK